MARAGVGAAATSPTAAAAAPAGSAPSAPAPSAPSRDVLEDVLTLDLPFPESRQRVMDEFERRYVERVLARHGGSVVRAAEASGIARRYFQIIRARQK
jgi:two-component system response regulator HydG